MINRYFYQNLTKRNLFQSIECENKGICHYNNHIFSPFLLTTNNSWSLCVFLHKKVSIKMDFIAFHSWDKNLGFRPFNLFILTNNGFSTFLFFVLRQNRLSTFRFFKVDFFQLLTFLAKKFKVEKTIVKKLKNQTKI